jgi:hypothetical protein
VYLLLISIAVGLAILIPAGAEAEAQEDAAHMERFEAGFRFGLGDDRNEVYFRKYEVFFNGYLPWAWRPESGWILASRLDFTGAVLSAAGTTGFLGSLGPSLAVRKKGWIVGMDLGVSVAFLSEDHYGTEDLSGHFQFLTHGGISFFPVRNLSVGYEFQHVSNADIQQPNPGLNVHNLEISYRFW